MTQKDIDNGRINVLIGVAPVKAAKFIIFRINQTIQSQAKKSKTLKPKSAVLHVTLYY